MRLLPFYSQNNKKTTLARQKGFTLIEVIVSIVILGILAVFMTTGIAKIFEGYIFTRDNAETALTGQLALARIVKEFRSIDRVNTGIKTSIRYDYYRYDINNPEGILVVNRTLSWAGTSTSPLVLGGNTLAENINDFEITYHNHYYHAGDNTWNGTEKIIGINLKLKGAGNQVSSFSTRITPRNL
jgi:prepilin-type N-terminal cleavage/methylation domain-containing protein